MRKILLIILLLLLLALPKCGSDDETELHIDIAEHPEGGLYVTELLCIIVGCLYDEDDVTDIPADFEWMWSETSSGVGVVVAADHYTFTETQPQEIYLYFEAPSGYYFTGYWWMDITWTDEDGTQHYLESSKAHCTGSMGDEPITPYKIYKPES